MKKILHIKKFTTKNNQSPPAVYIFLNCDGVRLNVSLNRLIKLFTSANPTEYAMSIMDSDVCVSLCDAALSLNCIRYFFGLCPAYYHFDKTFYNSPVVIMQTKFKIRSTFFKNTENIKASDFLFQNVGRKHQNIPFVRR